MSATFLVTGFEPFRHHRVNPSWDALASLEPSLPSQVVCRQLPVDYQRAHQKLQTLLAELRPVAVLCMGLAQGHVFRMERSARRPAELCDIAGEDVSQGRWPWPLLNAALCQARVGVSQSSDAGQFVCESTYWSLLNTPQATAPAWAAFLHVPHVSETYPLARTTHAVRSVIRRTTAALASNLHLAPRSSHAERIADTAKFLPEQRWPPQDTDRSRSQGTGLGKQSDVFR